MDKVEVISFEMKDGDNNLLSTISVNKKLAHKDYILGNAFNLLLKSSYDQCVLNEFDLSIEGKFVEAKTDFLESSNYGCA